MSEKTKKLSSTGAASAVPSGNAILTVNSSGVVTPVKGTVIPPTATIRSTVTPAKNTEWLRVAECRGDPFFAIMSIVGYYDVAHGDAYPTVISFGGGSYGNVGYIKGRIKALVKSETVTQVRAVAENNRIYIDLLFAKGGGTPTIGLIGAYGVNLLTPSIAPATTDESKTYIYEL